jgi:alpha-L-arabinofuranosidase
MSFKSRIFIVFFLCLTLFSAKSQTKLTIDISKKGINISPTHYGIFFEDINHAADGGLYAELIRNRSFEDATTLDYWTSFNQTNAAVTASVETTSLLNSAQTQALKLSVTKASSTARAGIYNAGFWGVNVVNGRQYKLTFFAKCDAAFTGSVTASLESSTSVKYAQATVTGLTTGWQKFSCTLTATGNDPSARFVLSTNSTGTLWFDVVSLFPPTFNNRDNGLRPELAQLLADMHPKFMRFPGGCFIEGDNLANRFQWKKTIGKIEERPGHYNLWAYRTSDGMGFHEFLQLSEDIGAEPLYVVNVGLAHNDNQPYTNLSGYIQDALDALEYANGDASTTYGAMRAANGHPEPFNIKYIEIGNENYFGDNYGNRYLLFYNAIRAKYPSMNCIGNVAAWGTDSPTWTFSSPVQLLDEHYYRSPQWFVNQYNKYDSYSRTGPKIYAGEYAVTSGCGNGNLIAALGEAVYMAGMEKNSDVVAMNSYAPIFVNVNDRKWNPDMIVYNSSTVYGTPSYYVQKLFATNIGTVNIPIIDSLNVKSSFATGKVGLGTWSTVADYSTLSVKDSKGTTVISEPFTSASNWTPGTGAWSVAGGVYSQTSTSTDCRSVASTVVSDSVYTYSVKARKVSGNEGFLIVFGYKDTNNFYWWNIGGWGNTQHAIEQCVDGSKTVVSSVAGSVASNVWYDIRIEVTKTKVFCYLNNTLIQSFDIPKSVLLYTAASLDETSKQLFVKVINPAATDVTSKLVFKGFPTSKVGGNSTILTSANAADENSLTELNKISPVITTIDSLGNNYTFKANSVTIFKLNTSNVTAVPVVINKNQQLSVFPNPGNGYICIKGAELKNISVDIRDLSGQTLVRTIIMSGNKIDITALKSGAYMLTAQQGTNVSSWKLIKE